MKSPFTFPLLYLFILINIQQVHAQADIALLKPFSRIIVSSSNRVELIKSDKFGYSIEPAHLASQVNVYQSGDEIKISDNEISSGATAVQSSKVLISIYGSCPSSIRIIGAGEVISKSEFRSCSPDLVISGSGNLTLSGNFDDVTASISGAGDMNLRGTCNLLSAVISGTGDLDSKLLESKSVRITVSGAGDSRVNVLNSLEAVVSGAGSVLYYGNPQERKVKITGVGSVRQMGSSGNYQVENDTNNVVNADDTTSIKIGGTKILIIDDDGNKRQVEIESDDLEPSPSLTKKRFKVKHVWSGFEIGINGYYYDAFKSFSIPSKEYELDYPRSININLNPYERHIRIVENYLSLGTGFGFSFNRYMFDKGITLKANADILDTIMSGVDYNKNMLKVSYLTAPLFLQFTTHSNPRKAFHLAAGIVGGLRLGARTKQIWDDNGRQKKIVRDSYNLNPFRYSLMLRLGYGKLNFYADYAFSGMFRENKGPELYPFSAGITLIPFRS